MRSPAQISPAFEASLARFLPCRGDLSSQWLKSTKNFHTREAAGPGPCPTRVMKLTRPGPGFVFGFLLKPLPCCLFLMLLQASSSCKAVSQEKPLCKRRALGPSAGKRQSDVDPPKGAGEHLLPAPGRTMRRAATEMDKVTSTEAHKDDAHLLKA